ncbi:hypothetical protein PoB_003009600 [Plakobranchus ocellatus]|uniref:Uncharacterized protein n=1 Tax=Plakobranchus ocellatus TaxID=259542 RepID=A0AAV4A5Q7_9GAST|nr:hypothetical protein PoB_003009600 [Plakobranchus ocellatus]
MISDFQALCRAKMPATGLEPSTKESLQSSGRVQCPPCHQRPRSSFVPILPLKLRRSCRRTIRCHSVRQIFRCRTPAPIFLLKGKLVLP